MPTLQDFKNAMSKATFGKTVEEALQSGMCINCGEEALVKCYSEAGRKEYKISGLCELCFDAITNPL